MDFYLYFYFLKYCFKFLFFFLTSVTVFLVSP